MAAPGNTPPPRPRAVPAAARWDAVAFEWTAGAADADGRPHGRHASWTRYGALHGERDYDHGRAHGKVIAYHPDGTVASDADWQDGALVGRVMQRCAIATPEPFVAGAAGAWSVRCLAADGKIRALRYYDRDGVECGPDGAPVPPRPPGVPAEASWHRDIERWALGELASDSALETGCWRWWSAAGVLRREEQRDERGWAIAIAHYAASGAVEQRIARDGDPGAGTEQRESFDDHGVLVTRQRSDARGREIYRARWSGAAIEHEAVREYAGDALASVVERGAHGVKAFEARRAGDVLACVLYGADGLAQVAAGAIDPTREQLAGVWQVFDAAGRVRRTLDTAPLALAHGPTGAGLAWQLGAALFATDMTNVNGAPAEPALAELADAPSLDAPDDPELAARLAALVAADPLVRDYAFASLAPSLDDPALAARALEHVARLVAHPRADRSRLYAAIDELARRTPLDPVWPRLFRAYPRATAAERRQLVGFAAVSALAKADLVALARTDADPVVRAAVVDQLAALPAVAPGDLEPVLADRDVVVRTVAAIALARRRRADATRETIRALDDALRTWRDLARRYAELPLGSDPGRPAHVLVALAEAAAAIGTPDARSLARELCARAEDVEPATAVAYGRALLALALGAGERPFAKRCLEILDTLARSKLFWSREHDASAALRAFRLPATRLSLGTLVALARASADPEATLHAKLQTQRF